MKRYKRILEEHELKSTSIPKQDRFDTVLNRLFYSLIPYQGRYVWKRTSQGQYNWLLSQGYMVSHVDNAIFEDEDFKLV